MSPPAPFDGTERPADPDREPPGRHLLALARLLVSRQAYEAIFVQTVRDLQEEWNEATEAGGRGASARVRIRGYASLVRAAVVHVLFTATDAATSRPPDRETREAGLAHAPHGRIAMRRPRSPSTSAGSLETLTANDRLKRSFDSRLWASIIVATVLHLLFFALFPSLTAADLPDGGDELVHLPPPPPVDIPPAPEPLTRPALPVGTADVPMDITIPVNVPGDGNFPELPPPPESDESARSARPTITPHTVRPRVRNREAVARALEREYPPLLRDAGIAGRVVIWFFIDEEGRVRETRVRKSSGQPSLDTAALEVAHVFEFTPAMNLDETVPVWIQIPIVFEAP